MDCPWQVDYHRMSQLDVGKCGVWAVDENNEIFYREGTYGENGSDGSHWVKVSLSNDLNALFAETDLDFADNMGAPTAKTALMDHTG